MWGMNDNGSATFRLYAPDAKKVELAGDVRAEKIEKADNGVWTMTTASNINPSAYRYYFNVDGMRVNDPKAYKEEIIPYVIDMELFT